MRSASLNTERRSVMADYAKETMMRTLDSLKEHPSNPRKGSVDSIKVSLKENGQYKPIIVQKSTNHILAGNHTYLAAKELGWEELMTLVIDVDDEKATKIMLADNRTADDSSYDNSVLIDVLKNLDDLVGTGYEAVDLEMMMRAEARELESVDHVVDVDSFDPYEKIEVAEQVAMYRDRGKWDVEVVRDNEKIQEMKEEEEQQKDEWEEAAYETHQPGLMINAEAVFDKGSLPYDWPPFDTDMLIETLPCMDDAKWKCWDGKRDVPNDTPDKWYLWNFGTKSNVGMPYDRSVVSFFCEDHNFRGFYREPGNYIMRIPKVGIKYAIQPDDSVFMEMPQAEKIHAVYRSLWVARMLQTVGVRVMPKMFTMETMEEIEEFNCFIPKNVPFLAIQLQTVDEDDPISVNMVHLQAEYIRERIKPHQLLVYTGMQGIRALNNIDFGVDKDNTLMITSHMMLRSFHYDIRKKLKKEHAEKHGAEENLITPLPNATYAATLGHQMPKG